MGLPLHLGVSKLTLLFLALLCPLPWTATSYPHLLPVGEGADLESALLPLRAALRDTRAGWLVQLDPWAKWPRDPRGEEDGEEDRAWQEEGLLRSQRGDLVAQLLSPFPRSHPLESMNYQDGEDGEDGGRRNEALTSIAGGLQAVSREKGGFGFRFGRKRSMMDG